MRTKFKEISAMFMESSASEKKSGNCTDLYAPSQLQILSNPDSAIFFLTIFELSTTKKCLF